MDSAVHRYPPAGMPLDDHDAPLFPPPPPKSSGFLKKFQLTENKGLMSHNYRHFTSTRPLSALQQTPEMPPAWQRSRTIRMPSRRHLCANASNRSKHTAHEAQPMYLVRGSGAFRRLSIPACFSFPRGDRRKAAPSGSFLNTDRVGNPARSGRKTLWATGLRLERQHSRRVHPDITPSSSKAHC